MNINIREENKIYFTDLLRNARQFVKREIMATNTYNEEFGKNLKYDFMKKDHIEPIPF